MRLDGKQLPWLVAGAIPLLYLGRRLKSWYTLKHLETHILSGPNGMEVHISPLGGIIQRLYVPDITGELEDVVLGYNDLEAYMNGPCYFGAVVGRCANRIARGQFTLEGHTHKLAINNPPNALHGGKRGFDKVIWDSERIAHPSGEAVRLTYTSKDGEEGYPGTLRVSVTYVLTREGVLRVVFEATTDRQTPVNIVQHSYFNLAGHASGSAVDHTLYINGDHYTPLDDTAIPTGEIAAVAGTPFDFSEAHRIGDALGQVPGGYDHNYCLFGMGRQAKFIVKAGAASTTPKLAAKLTDPRSGRSMKVLTTAPGIQFYSGNFIEGQRGKGGAVYAKHGGVCLETQGFPNAVNEHAFPSIILGPGERYTHEVDYVFSAE